LVTWAVIMEGGIQVNAEGRRFCDESRGYSEQAAEVLRQQGGIAWNLFDDRIANVARQFEDFRNAEKGGALLTAATLDDLAVKTRVPGEALKEEWHDAERCKASGASDRFGRRFSGEHAFAAPWHAVKVTGALFHTQGGLVVDETARVCRADGTALPNLFAAGGAAAGVSGPAVWGYLSGNGLLSAVALGRIAGKAAAALAR
jgi:fumarate reductase flavoprotein subunit